MTGYRTVPRETQLVFNVYRSNVIDKVVFQVSCEVSGEVLFINRYIICPNTVQQIIEFGEDNTKDFNVKEDDCIIKTDRGNIRFSGRGRTITVVDRNLAVLVQCMADSGIGTSLTQER